MLKLTVSKADPTTGRQRVRTVTLHGPGTSRLLGWINQSNPAERYVFQPAAEFTRWAPEWEPQEIAAHSQATLSDLRESIERHIFVALCGSYDPPHPSFGSNARKGGN